MSNRCSHFGHHAPRCPACRPDLPNLATLPFGRSRLLRATRRRGGSGAPCRDLLPGACPTPPNTHFLDGSHGSTPIGLLTLFEPNWSTVCALFIRLRAVSSMRVPNVPATCLKIQLAQGKEWDFIDIKSPLERALASLPQSSAHQNGRRTFSCKL